MTKHTVKHLQSNGLADLQTTTKAGFTLAEGATHVGVFDNCRRCAFTLAEVLITLGIIGIVTVLTLPTLIKNHQEDSSDFNKADWGTNIVGVVFANGVTGAFVYNPSCPHDPYIFRPNAAF